jgi:hypothetical protein
MVLLYYIILYYIILYYIIIGPSSYIRLVVDRNVVMRRILVKVTLSLNLIANHARHYTCTSTNQCPHHTGASGAVSHPGRSISKKIAPIPTQQDAGWTAESFRTLASIGEKVWEHYWVFWGVLNYNLQSNHKKMKCEGQVAQIDKSKNSNKRVWTVHGNIWV